MKHYRSATVRDALALARHELGPEALVLSTRTVRSRGWRGLVGRREVELTAAAERELSVTRPPAQDGRHLRASADALIARLTAAGVDADLAADVAASLPPARQRAASAAMLREALGVSLDRFTTADVDAARVQVFVGPPGAGKTTTIAKLAAQTRIRSRQRPHLVAADGFRVGAVEQLRLYADIVGAPFHEARTPAELAGVLSTVDGPVLVDTAGRSPDDGMGEGLFAVLRNRPDVRTHLVIAASAAPQQIRRTIDRFRIVDPRSLVITKVDETDTFSALLMTLRRSDAPAVSYLGVGQRVPEDLIRATGAMLASCVLGDPAVAIRRSA